MSTAIYAVLSSEKVRSTLVNELEQIDENLVYSTPALNENFFVTIAPTVTGIGSTGMYPDPVLVPSVSPLSGLSPANSDLIRQQHEAGEKIIRVELAGEDDVDLKVITAVRKAANHVIKVGGFLTFNQITNNSNDPVDILNHLIALCLDGAEGYQAAADRVKDPLYFEVFKRYADQRREFATHLSDMVTSLNGQPETSSTWLGTLHKTWLKFNTAIARAGYNINTILTEAKRGEDVAQNAFEEAFDKDLPKEIKELLRTQLSHIYDANSQITALVAATNP